MDLLILIIALIITFTTGSMIEKNHFKKIKEREKALLKQPFVSFGKKSYSSKKPIKKVEMVTGEVVISGDYFKSFVSSLRNIIGGKMVSYESLMERARREAVLRMREKAKGASIIVNTKIESTMINNPNDPQDSLPQVAVIAYGTAISYDNNDLEQRYLDLIEDGGNVSETSDVKEFFTVIGIIIALLISIFFASDFIAKTYINHMTNETQGKIEKLLARNIYTKPNPKYNKELALLNNIKNKIIPLDKNLQGKSNFPIQVYPSKEINAFVTADGSIYFTEGILKEITNEEELAFVLAHEIGHYSHRDHLKFIGRQIIIASVLTAVSIGQSNHFSSLASTANEIGNISYSQKQEKEADIYANHIVLSLYGRNKGAIDFFNKLEKKEKMPQFMHYFSTHPSTQYRIKLLKNNK